MDGLNILRLNSSEYNILNWLAILTKYRRYWQNGSIAEEAKDLKSETAFEHIQFVDAEPAMADIYYEKKSIRDRKARCAYRDTRRTIDGINELYMLDIMREGIKNGDPRLR